LNSPNPALVTHRAAQRLPRLALFLFCAAYVIPGVFGRDPWKNADITAFGYMVSMAEGRSSWFAPALGGLPSDAAFLPYWLGAAFIKLMGPLLGAPLAARLPFAALLALVLLLTWYSTYHLARTDAAQPVPFAFGGEANPIDYARAIADGALLAVIASLGLLQLGHETTPELAQLASVSLYLYGLASMTVRDWGPRIAVLVALPALAGSGAPAVAVALGVIGTLVCWHGGTEHGRRHLPFVIGSTVLAALAAWMLGAWGWRLNSYGSSAQVLATIKLLVWFPWPAWPLAFWTLWRWRRQLTQQHIAIPLGCVLVSLAACIAMGGSDRALMLALPPLAVLASFALPTLQRSTSAAVDWFAVFFFSVCALSMWVVYVSLQTGVPATPAANVARRLTGYASSFSIVSLVLASLGTLAWVWLVRWRTGRHRNPLWKSLVLPAGGVALCWMLLTTLWLPMLDYARSYRPLIDRIARQLPKDQCVNGWALPRGQIAALEYMGGYQVDAVNTPALSRCDILMRLEPATEPKPPIAGWTLVARAQRPSDKDELTAIYRRNGTR
jgi:4-amino-4-deoxy-L-arabinose transferase-like glycosyltransferase